MIGSAVGSYRITARLGEGGMGVVYRATDTQLGREVALKVLPEGFTQDRERLARFEREAKVLASLNHPHIAHIYGFETSDVTPALVMELVEGPTLAERLERGALPVPEALGIARQIAAALEEAHDKGIVHRDLKPQNIKVSDDDQVKVLDFGLAKAMEESGGASTASQLAHSPTITFGATVEGVILGTAAYMAPEQAAGKVVDRRADIWAFGVVLWEMLTGRTLFAADSVPETLAGVLRGEIDLDALPAETPAAIRRLLRRCLERQPRARLRDIGDARIVLDDVLSGKAEEVPSSATAASGRVGRRGFGWTWIAGALVVGAIVVGVLDRSLLAPPPAEPPTIVPLTYSGFDSQPDVAPDGKTVAFVSTRDGRSRIWIKQLATGEEVPLTRGSDIAPRISPDGSSIVYVHLESPSPGIYRVSLFGGEPRRLARDGVEPIWSPDGRSILFDRTGGTSDVDTFVRIPADGGTEKEVAQLKGMTASRIAWSPDGRQVAIRAFGRQNFVGRHELLLLDVTSGEIRTLKSFPGGSIGGGLTWIGDRALLMPLGASQAGKGPFRLLLEPVSEGAERNLMSLNALPNAISYAGPGKLVVDAPEIRSNLRVVELAAGPTPAGDWLSRGASVDRQPTFSRDGKSLMFTSDRGGSLDLWTLSLESSTLRRLTHDAADDWDPYFAPDGEHVLWSSSRSGNYEIWSAGVDGSGARQLSHDGVDAENPTMTPDGAWIVFVSSNPKGPGIWKMRSDGSAAQLLLGGAFTIPEVSPDGRWVASVDANTLSQERTELRIVRVEDGADVARFEVWQGTLNPGLFGVTVGRSRWMPDGKTLAFLSANPDELSEFGIYAQPVASGRDTSGERRLLYRGSLGSPPESFGISPDGKRLVVSIREDRSDLEMIDGLQGIDGR